MSLKLRARSSFWIIVAQQGGWWIWATVLVTRFRQTLLTYDWADAGFGAAFGVFVFLTIGFQINYLFLLVLGCRWLHRLIFRRYFIIHNLAKDEAEIIRFAALLRGTESAWYVSSCAALTAGTDLTAGRRLVMASRVSPYLLKSEECI